MATYNSAAEYLKPLALHFADHEEIKEDELHKNKNWKKIMSLSTAKRYDVILIAFRGILQKRNPGYENGLWKMLVAHDLEYILQKGNIKFLYDISEEIKKIRDVNTLPFTMCWNVIQSLKKPSLEGFLYMLLENLLKKHSKAKVPSKNLEDFISKIAGEFDNISKIEMERLQNEVYQIHANFSFADENDSSSKWGKYFVDTQEQEEAWHRLEQDVKTVVQQYEEDLFYDRSPKPSQERKDQTIQAVENSKLNKKHKKVLIESIKKKG